MNTNSPARRPRPRFVTALAEVPPIATTILDLSEDVITDTTLTPRGAATDVRYTVETHTARLMGMPMRLVIRESERVLATVRRWDLLPDLITLEGKLPMWLSRWFKWPRPESFPVTFKDDGTIYAWHYLYDDRIVLSKGTTPDAPKIAWFSPSYWRGARLKTRYAAYLALTPDADAIRERVLISCVLVVQRMRAQGIRQAGVSKEYGQGLFHEDTRDFSCLITSTSSVNQAKV